MSRHKMCYRQRQFYAFVNISCNCVTNLRGCFSRDCLRLSDFHKSQFDCSVKMISMYFGNKYYIFVTENCGSVPEEILRVFKYKQRVNRATPFTHFRHIGHAGPVHAHVVNGTLRKTQPCKRTFVTKRPKTLAKHSLFFIFFFDASYSAQILRILLLLAIVPLSVSFSFISLKHCSNTDCVLCRRYCACDIRLRNKSAQVHFLKSASSIQRTFYFEWRLMKINDTLLLFVSIGKSTTLYYCRSCTDNNGSMSIYLIDNIDKFLKIII